MQVKIPVRLFALPEARSFNNTDETTGEVSRRTSYQSQCIMGADSVKFWSDTDPTLPTEVTPGLNGSRAKLEAGEIIVVDAIVRLYPRKTSGVGVVLEGFAEQGK